MLTVTPLSPVQHAQLALKSFIVACSWLATYFALKHLPLSIASPIRATAPVWTLFGALLVLGERPTWLQMVGIAITLGSFIGLSIAGQREGIHFHRNKWVWWSILGMILGAGSTLYDKYLLGRAGFDAPTVQAWFSIYLAIFFLLPALGWKLRWWTRHEFHWRWSIVFLTLALLVSDYVYFSALRDPGGADLASWPACGAATRWWRSVAGCSSSAKSATAAKSSPSWACSPALSSRCWGKPYSQ